MATKTLKTRIQLKYDTYKNWTDNNPTPLSGELCVVVVPAEAGAVVQEPALLLKVGDGSTPFNSLNFVGGVAADVYDWAKAENKPTYKAAEITGIDTYISQYVNEQMGISVDTDTQYTIVKVNDYQYKLQSKSKADSAFTDTGVVIDIPKYDDTALAGRVTAVEGLVGSTAVATQIANAIVALDLANTYEPKGKGAEEAGKVQDALDEYIESNDGVIAAIKDGTSIDSFKDVENALAGKQAAGDYATKTEAQGYANAKDEAIAAAQQAADDAQADVDALAEKVGEVPADKTVVQMISDAQSAATYDDTKVKEDIQKNADAITKLNANSTTEGSVDYKIAQAVAAIMENPDDTMNSINELVTWINDHAADALELSNKVTANEQDIAALEGLVGSTAVATQITDAIAAALKIDGVDKYALATDLTAAIGRIAALETEIAKKANDADLAAIAKSGNVNDLIQTDGDYIIFNCGSSSEVI